MITIKTVTSEYSDAIGKNKLLKESSGDHIFLVYDYVKILDPSVYARFVLASQKTGFECLCTPSFEPSNKKPIYVADPWIDYWLYPGTDFVMYTRNALEKVGYLNENFPPNTWEDVEHIKRIGDKALTAPFGFFCGIKNERKYLFIDQELKQKQLIDVRGRNDEFKTATEYWKSLDPSNFPEMPTQEEEGMKLKKAQGQMI